MKCPHCGEEIEPGPVGRPRTLDDKQVRKLKAKGKSLAEIAEKFGVTRGAVQAALKRGEK